MAKVCHKYVGNDRAESSLPKSQLDLWHCLQILHNDHVSWRYHLIFHYHSSVFHKTNYQLTTNSFMLLFCYNSATKPDFNITVLFTILYRRPTTRSLQTAYFLLIGYNTNYKLQLKPDHTALTNTVKKTNWANKHKNIHHVSKTTRQNILITWNFPMHLFTPRYLAILHIQHCIRSHILHHHH